MKMRVAFLSMILILWEPIVALSSDQKLKIGFEAAVESFSSMRVFQENCRMTTDHVMLSSLVDIAVLTRAWDRDDLQRYVALSYRLARGRHSSDCNLDALETYSRGFFLNAQVFMKDLRASQ
ncbi:hypothetical protein ACJ4V0_06595 [Phreatobacter sp. HK31-P]